MRPRLTTDGARACGLALAGLAAAAPGADGLERVRLPDGRRLAMRCSGKGAPTVIMEAGFGGSSLAWARVQARVAKTTRVCAYDRAGYGLSDVGPMPRDGAAVVRDLDAALKRARIKGPYVLVGHSAGGLYVRLFAARRRDDVVGMVLADPSIEHQDRRFAAVFGPGAGSLEGQRTRAARCLAATEARVSPQDPDYAACVSRATGQLHASGVWRTQMSEAETLWGATSDQVDRIGDLLEAIPTIVLTAEASQEGAAEPGRLQAQQLWSSLHREMAGRSLQGSVRKVDSSHMMMTDRPGVIAGAVEELVGRARGETPG